MKESQVRDKIRNSLENLLRNIPFVKVGQFLKGKSLGGIRPDLLLEVTVKGRSLKVAVEVKSIGEPRQIRYAIQQLKEYLSRLKDTYGVVAAPYISNDTANICKENEVGYLDLAGNCFLGFEQVYIERKNYPNPKVEKRPLRSLFTPKSSRILRTMLLEPRKSWQVQELTNEAKVSLGLTFKIKERLLDLEYAGEKNRGIFLSRPNDLLEKWAENYSFRKNKMYDYFGFGDPRELERRMAKYCQNTKTPYALTLFSGVALVAPFARYTRAFIYVGKEIQEAAESVGLKEVSSGPNITLLEPYDEGVFYGSREIREFIVACDVQLYLDLVGYRGRGEESAKFLLEQRIKPQW